MNCLGNHLRICKMNSVNGRLVKPGEDEVFHINVESCSQRRHYRLNSSNCFCVELESLSNEEVCVYEEENGYEVSYEIDGVESEEACVSFNRQSFHTITIINHEEDPQEYGSLRLSKRIVNMCGNTDTSRESFSFEVRGDDFMRTVVLGPNNNYTTLLENLSFGAYVVRELNARDYDVSYIVDGVERESGEVEINTTLTNMIIVNRKNNGTHYLRICKWIRENGKLVKPNYSESYDVVLSDGYALREYTLNCDNRFCTSVEGNRNDTFTIEEVSAENVEYEVDGEMVDSVEVTMNQDHDVRIINVNEDEGNGSIFVRKWLEEEGRLIVPNADQIFRFRIQGLSENVYTLNDRNNFSMEIENVESGYYYINEIPTEGYEVTFEIDGTAQEDGYFRVEENRMVNVDMINHEESGDTNILHIIKRLQSPNSDNVTIPNEGSFEIYLEGPEGGTYITLDENNHYQMRYRAVQGWYTVYEVNPSGNVTYRLDGVDHYNELNFYVDGFDHEVMIINHINRINYVI